MNIAQKIFLLRQEEKKLHHNMKILAGQIRDIHSQIQKLMDNEPQCSSCGRHRMKEDMILATQDDVDHYEDSGEGYGVPVVGEYYCGC